ncbi:hypothetical protein [Micromonospora endolithica]|uniref:Uncharacterized protein n=1 Tax=Micromonospora endolithica TaxID=230091 RepID=A0A3A9ZR22_9ACTN|nr:hypothetical protein [Micromonospora endolithica]RKN50728.1 hypothetical protein D7223_02905 [Micromonospora endolithica]TWJ20531.1 hypothetical protein JD76_00629 [Micromonospora endolithica]
MGFDQTDVRKGVVADVLARLMPTAHPDTPRAMAREILDLMPALLALDDARREIARLEEERDRLGQPGGDLAAVALPPPGTTVARALALEAAELRAGPDTAPQMYAMGFRAGRNAFLGNLESRAAHLAATDPGPHRPGPGTGATAVPPEEEEEPPQTLARQGLGAALSQLPPDRQSYWLRLIEGELLRWWSYSGLRTGSGPIAAAALDALRPELDGLDDAYERLTALEAETHELRRGRAEVLAAVGITPAELHWRQRFAAELRGQADQVRAQSGQADMFTLGYNLAGTSLAKRLRKRADEVVGS